MDILDILKTINKECEDSDDWYTVIEYCFKRNQHHHIEFLEMLQVDRDLGYILLKESDRELLLRLLRESGNDTVKHELYNEILNARCVNG
jgi:hypothetical protein